MRYSFHGKVRASGQQVDGFVEAANATEAIDRLADRGIIGVYSVRPEPKPQKNAVILASEAARIEEEEARAARHARNKPNVVPKRIATARPVEAEHPAPALPAPTPAVAAAPVSSVTEANLLQMMEKLTVLMSRVERAFTPDECGLPRWPGSRSGFSPGAKRATKISAEVQTSTLHDIFQNNLDLRKSLDKLATTVGQPPAKAIAAPAAAPVPSAPAPVAAPADNSSDTVMGREFVQPREPAVRENLKPAREPVPNGQKLTVQAQSA